MIDDPRRPLLPSELPLVDPKLRPLVEQWWAEGEAVPLAVSQVDVSTPLTAEDEAWVAEVAARGERPSGGSPGAAAGGSAE